MLTVKEFREHFPAFTASLYPDDAVEIRLELAEDFFSESTWTRPAVRRHVMALYAAHYLQAYGSPAAGGGGSGSGSGMGVVSSKSVDGVSVSYDTSVGSESNAGFWNTTPYGRELWQLMRIYSPVAVQL